MTANASRPSCKRAAPTLPGLKVDPPPPTIYRIDSYWPSPSPALVAAAERGELPGCVEVVAHRVRGKIVTLSNVNLNEVVLGVGFWKRSAADAAGR